MSDIDEFRYLVGGATNQIRWMVQRVRGKIYGGGPSTSSDRS